MEQPANCCCGATSETSDNWLPVNIQRSQYSEVNIQRPRFLQRRKRGHSHSLRDSPGMRPVIRLQWLLVCWVFPLQSVVCPVYTSSSSCSVRDETQRIKSKSKTITRHRPIGVLLLWGQWANCGIHLQLIARLSWFTTSDSTSCTSALIAKIKFYSFNYRSCFPAILPKRYSSKCKWSTVISSRGKKTPFNK